MLFTRYARFAFCSQERVADEYGRCAAVAFFVVDTVCFALNGGGSVGEQFVAGFQFFERLFERAARAFHTAVASGFVVDGDRPGVAVTFQVVLTVGGGTF